MATETTCVGVCADECRNEKVRFLEKEVQRLSGENEHFKRMLDMNCEGYIPRETYDMLQEKFEAVIVENKALLSVVKDLVAKHAEVKSMVRKTLSSAHLGLSRESFETLGRVMSE